MGKPGHSEREVTYLSNIHGSLVSSYLIRKARRANLMDTANPHLNHHFERTS